MTESGQPLPNLIIYYGFTALAMYDAVVAIEGRYEPWSQLPRANFHASPQFAAATAAYHVLHHYFPTSAAALNADYEAALADAKDRASRAAKALAVTLGPPITVETVNFDPNVSNDGTDRGRFYTSVKVVFELRE